MSSSKKSAWQNKLAFYLLAIGSACGLGNIWRFPYVVGENGGGAFLLLYLLISFTVGLSLLVAELTLGYAGESSLIKITQRIFNQKPFLSKVSRLSLFISLVMLAYYSVISGWVIHYMGQFLVGLFRDDRFVYLYSLNLNVLSQNGILQFLLASVHLSLCGLIVIKGVTETFEKILSFVLPVFVIIVVILVSRSLSLEASGDVLRFLLYPDFSKLNLNSLGQATGHVLFTLSLGMGTLVTFGSYFKGEKQNIPLIGTRVTAVDTIISILAVLMILPISFSLSEKPMTDPGLLFEVLPQMFMRIKFGEYFGLLFFISLWIAAMNASLGLLETLVDNFADHYKIKNKSAGALSVVGVTSLLTIIPAFSGTVFKNIKFMGQTVIESLDSILINFLLPVSALIMISIFFKSLTEHQRREKFMSESSQSEILMYGHWIWVLKWLAPGVIVLGLILQIVAAFRN